MKNLHEEPRKPYLSGILGSYLRDTNAEAETRAKEQMKTHLGTLALLFVGVRLITGCTKETNDLAP